MRDTAHGIGTRCERVCGMDVMPLATLAGTRELNLREARNVCTPPDLKGAKLRMGSMEAVPQRGARRRGDATRVRRGLPHPKSGTIDGQDKSLPTVRAAKFDEVTKQLMLAHHLVDGILLSISDKNRNALSAAQRAKVKAAARWGMA